MPRIIWQIGSTKAINCDAGVVWERDYSVCPRPTLQLAYLLVFNSFKALHSHNANGNALEVSFLVSHAYNILDCTLKPLIRGSMVSPAGAYIARIYMQTTARTERTTSYVLL